MKNNLLNTSLKTIYLILIFKIQAELALTNANQLDLTTVNQTKVMLSEDCTVTDLISNTHLVKTYLAFKVEVLFHMTFQLFPKSYLLSLSKNGLKTREILKVLLLAAFWIL